MKGVLHCFCLVTTVISIFSSCQKDKDETDPLINSTWKISMQDDNPATNPPGEFGMDGSNIYFPWMTCHQDNSFTFGKDGQLHIDPGLTYCEGGSSWWMGPSVVPYEYDRERKEVTFHGVRFTIGEITARRLKLYTAVPSESGIGYMVYLFRR